MISMQEYPIQRTLFSGWFRPIPNFFIISCYLFLQTCCRMYGNTTRVHLGLHLLSRGYLLDSPRYIVSFRLDRPMQ